jgi:hypothetical protein
MNSPANNDSISWWVVFAMWVPGIATCLYVWRKLRKTMSEADRLPDPDAVMAQRQLYADGEFRRHWIRRSPDDLNMDRLELECGHWTYHVADQPLDTEKLVECRTCARRYLKSAQKGLKR